jgi:hypothetical protein
MERKSRVTANRAKQASCRLPIDVRLVLLSFSTNNRNLLIPIPELVVIRNALPHAFGCVYLFHMAPPSLQYFE